MKGSAMTTPRVSKPDYDRTRIGGLMRCCLATLDDLYPNGPAKIAVEGQTLHCKFIDGANHAMIFRDGAWEWDRNPATDPSPSDEGTTDDPEASSADPS